MITKTVSAYGISEDVPLRRLANDCTFMVALASPRRRNLAPHAVVKGFHALQITVSSLAPFSRGNYGYEFSTTNHSRNRNTEIGPLIAGA